MITGTEAEKIERAIADNATKDAQWAIAYGLLAATKALNAISSTVGYERMIVEQRSGIAISDSLNNIASAISELTPTPEDC